MSGRFQRAFLRTFIPLCRLYRNHLLSIIRRLISTISRRLSISIVQVMRFAGALRVDRARSNCIELVLVRDFFCEYRNGETLRQRVSIGNFMFGQDV